jgi:RHS repeat-associated protein
MTASSPKNIPSITYDPFTQMTKNITITGTPTHTVNFQYSADNERILKNEKQGTTNNNNVYIRGNNDYPLTEKININNTLNDKIYIYGPSGLIAVKEGYFAYFVIKDHLGSTRVLFRSVGTYYSTYDYSPFGGLMRTSGNTDVLYKFTGQEYDNETALYNFRARLYDDELGIFYATDPGGQNFSPYSYAGNNPVIYVDKDGKFGFLAALGIAALIGGTIDVIAHWNEVQQDPWAGLGYFVHGAAQAATFTAISLAAPELLGIAAPAGLIPGIAYGVGVGGFSGALTNFIYGEDIQSGFWGGAISLGLAYGFNGLALANELNLDPVWGTAPALTTPEIPAITSQIPAPKLTQQQLELPRVGSNLSQTQNIAGELPEQGPVRLINKPEIPLKNLTTVSNIQKTIDNYYNGVKLFSNDGLPYKNLGPGLLPLKPLGYYTEYTVPFQGITNNLRGLERIVFGAGGEIYYTPNHYQSFIRIR